MASICVAHKGEKCVNCEHCKYDEDKGRKCCFAKPDRLGQVYYKERTLKKQ